MHPENDREPFHYANNLREFLAGTGEPFPLVPWLAALDEDDLGFLVDAIDEHSRRGGEIDSRLFSDVLAVVVQLMATESPAPSFSCSGGQPGRPVSALGVRSPFEQMRRAGVPRMLSPTVLTRGHTPAVELAGSA